MRSPLEAAIEELTQENEKLKKRVEALEDIIKEELPDYLDEDDWTSGPV